MNKVKVLYCIVFRRVAAMMTAGVTAMLTAIEQWLHVLVALDQVRFGRDLKCFVFITDRPCSLFSPVFCDCVCRYLLWHTDLKWDNLRDDLLSKP